MLHLSSIRASIALAAASLLVGGCDLIDALSSPGDTLITVFANHHASPEDGGAVPDLGGDGEVRVFENDEGWTIHLTAGLIATTGVTLQRCDGREAAVDLYFGTMAEDLRSADLDRRTLGGTEVGSGSYCGVTVHYGAFSADSDDAPTDMDAKEVDGLTVYLEGVAERGEERVPFQIAARGQVDVDLDLGSLQITGDEPFPVEVTITKTYDRFFDGIDFSAFDQEDATANAFAILELETRAVVN